MFRTLSRWIVRLAWLVWLIVMLLIGIKLALDNAEKVEVALLGWQTPELSLGVALCMALLTGVILGWLASSGPYLLARQRTRRLQKRLSQTEKEVSSLRTAPLKQ